VIYRETKLVAQGYLIILRVAGEAKEVKITNQSGHAQPTIPHQNPTRGWKSAGTAGYSILSTLGVKKFLLTSQRWIIFRFDPGRNNFLPEVY